MLLDRTQLAEADLTGEDFHGTSLRGANLNNAILDGADFRYADLSGVRLEEAGDISSLSVPRSADAVFVAYRDGTVRQWSLDVHSRHDSEVVFRVSDEPQSERGGPLRIAALPGAGLCLWDRETVRFLDAEGKTYRQISRFSLTEPYLAITPAITIAEKNMAVLIGGQTDTRREARLFDFSPEKLPSMRVFPRDSYVECVALDGLPGVGALAGILTDGGVTVRIWSETEGKVKATLLGNIPSPTCIAAYRPDPGADDPPDTFQVACGNREGIVAAWRFTLTESGACVDREEIFGKAIHKGAVKALCFVNGETLLTGGADGKIRRIALPDGQEPHDPFQLILHCTGTKIDGLEGKKERDILLAAGAKTVDGAA